MLSVIIPTLDEQTWLPRCLDAVAPQAREISAEILVVDGGSRDATAEVVRTRPGVRWLEAPRGRGRQMNAGAEEASGSLLVFLPADTLVGPGALQILHAIDDRRSPRAGGFRQRFDSSRAFLRTISVLTNLRSRLTGVFYGDQAPFVQRDLFEELGGFREIDMEDVEFGMRLRRRTRTVLLDASVVTSARRFEHVGPVRATATAAAVLAWWVVFRRAPRSRVFFEPIR